MVCQSLRLSSIRPASISLVLSTPLPRGKWAKSCTPVASLRGLLLSPSTHKKKAMNHGGTLVGDEQIATSLRRAEEEAEETSQQQGRRGEVGVLGGDQEEQVTPRRQGLDRSDSYDDVVDKGASWRVLLSFAGISVGFPSVSLLTAMLFDREDRFRLGRPIFFAVCPLSCCVLSNADNIHATRLQHPSSCSSRPSLWSGSRCDPIHPFQVFYNNQHPAAGLTATYSHQTLPFHASPRNHRQRKSTDADSDSSAVVATATAKSTPQP